MIKNLKFKKTVISISFLIINYIPTTAIASSLFQGQSNSTSKAGVFNKVTWKDMSTKSKKGDFLKQDSSNNDSDTKSLSKYFKSENDNIDDSDDSISNKNVFSDDKNSSFDGSTDGNDNPFV